MAWRKNWVAFEASLSTAKFSLSAAGAQEGELLRLALGDEPAEAIMAVLQMVKRHSDRLRFCMGFCMGFLVPSLIQTAETSYFHQIV